MTEIYVNPWVRPVREDNPWVLPPLPEGYDRHQPRQALNSSLRQRTLTWLPRQPSISPRRANAMLNLAIACCVVFLTLVFPVLLHRGLTGSDSLLGWRFLVVTGDSMEPTIRAGALLLAKEIPFHRLEEGDVIVFEAGGTLITHRIEALEYGAAVTKGDAVLLPDAVPVTPEMYRCRVRKVFNGFAGISKRFIE
ncbi:MAG: signal peptidase I [Oscillospiraceae bacterium]|nr:signal peptidase I [Oscillospiraceae bacterium]